MEEKVVIQCKHCTCDDKKMIEIIKIKGTKATILCNNCSKESEIDVDLLQRL